MATKRWAFVLVLFTTLLTSVAQILFKKASQSLAPSITALISNYYLIGEICNIGEKDLEGHGLVSDISLYEDEDLVTTLMVIQNPSYTTLRKDSCKPFKHPLDKKYKYDKIKGNPYFFNILEDKD